MKILAISDIYGNMDLINDLRRKYSSENFDAIIVAGGICDEKKNNVHKIFSLLASLGEKILFVPGGSDQKEININQENIINIDGNFEIIEKNGLKIGFFGLGGVPERSIKKKRQYPYKWNESICFNDFIRKLKTTYQKLKLEKVVYTILVTHSPPYHIADYSRKITLNEFETTEELEDQDVEDKKKSTNPLFLGSKILREFTKNNKVDVHIFGHVHKEGGKKVIKDNTIFLNIAHLSPLPYKLTGRKICLVNIDKEINVEFQSVVNNKLEFEEFLRSYI